MPCCASAGQALSPRGYGGNPGADVRPSARGVGEVPASNGSLPASISGGAFTHPPEIAVFGCASAASLGTTPGPAVLAWIGPPLVPFHAAWLPSLRAVPHPHLPFRPLALCAPIRKSQGRPPTALRGGPALAHPHTRRVNRSIAMLHHYSVPRGFAAPGSAPPRPARQPPGASAQAA